MDRLAHRRKPPGKSRAILRGIPMARISWEEPQAGHFEVDLVHHSGPSPSGQYIHTVQMLDVATDWSECVAVLGRSQWVMGDGFEHIQARLPFDIVEIHPDNGSEFFNYHLLNYWKSMVQGVELSRCRPFQKNDNRFVEENNFSILRAYVGYQRLDTVSQIVLLNQLYDKLWWYHNFFQPVMRLRQKIVDISSRKQNRIKRIFDDKRTPFNRLCDKGALSPERQEHLLALRNTINPSQL